MRIKASLFLVLLFSVVSFAADLPLLYADAEAIWLKRRDSSEYQTYAAEFAQFNNHFHLDEKGGCYQISPEPVDLMLVITHSKGEKFAVIERAVSSVDSLKAQCFKNNYIGVPTKIPPYLPFVLQMRMG